MYSFCTVVQVIGRVLSMGGGGGGGEGGSFPPKAPSFSPKRRVAKELERGKEREEMGNVYYLGALII